jgi:lantibiotic modifying enzyme
VALFLAELAALTGEAWPRHTALGAIRQALRGVDTLPPATRWGLFTGGCGIALAGARVGILVRDAALLEHAARLIQRAIAEAPDGQGSDLIAGRAGMLAACVVLHALLWEASLLTYAIRLGEALLQSAASTAAGDSWPSADAPARRHLTGLAHGAAGVGYSLLELFTVTGEERYRHAAERAFAYERSWFDPTVGNWPDFRDEPARRRTGRPRAFATTWCHGAPGIALSRLRAYVLLHDEHYKAEALTALHTTLTSLATWLHTGLGNYSLCHGLTGNAETLLYGGQVFGPDAAEDAQLAYDVGQVGLEAYAGQGRPWPCGISRGDTPGLMLGLAGIGYFYLRLANPSMPSLLLLQRQQFVEGTV